MPTPTWLGATTDSAGQAGQVNQFLAAHAITYLYQGVQRSASMTTSGGSVNSNTAWLAQSFTTATGQTVTGYVLLYMAVTGSPSPRQVTLQTDNAGAPSGTILAAASVPKEFLGGFAWTPVPLPAAGLSASTRYWIVAQQTGDSGNHFSWAQTTAGSGASTSPDGTTWTAAAYGFTYQVFDQTPNLPLAGTWEDSGARWTWLTYTSGLITGTQEYTQGQIANGYTAAKRVLSYSGTLLTGVA